VRPPSPVPWAAVVEVERERFEELVADAIDGIPDELARLMDNVAVFVSDHGPPGLLGLYEGIPLTARAGYGTPVNGLPMPDRITIYRAAICAVSRDDADLVRQVQVTVVHEIAHHFGIGDARLHELGWA
jgi:predicted Zn-dependent protease with MMP-like domain